MKTAVIALVLLFAAMAHGDTKVVPSGPLKAYKGPEGEIVAMIEVNDGKEMLVYFKNLGPELDGKTLRYLLETDRDSKTVYINKKRGSKTYRSIMLTARDGQWDFQHPTKPTTHFGLSYSESASAAIKVDDVVNAYKP
jgi:hypothetical protein